jgi:hypothetical protein
MKVLILVVVGIPLVALLYVGIAKIIREIIKE